MVTTRAMKRSTSTTWDSLGMDTPPTNHAQRIPITIGYREQVDVYYRSALNNTRQRDCSTVIRAAIKFIQPQKQFEHPYKDKNANRPDWWPSCITHTNPGHMKKEDRIELFIHILYNHGGCGINADKLKEIATDVKEKLRNPEDIKIIHEVLRVRKIQEQVERGSNTVTYVNKEYASTNAALAVIEAPGRGDQGIEQDYVAPNNSSTPLEFGDVDAFGTFSSQVRDFYGIGTDIRPYESSMTSHFDVGFHNPMNQVSIRRNGLPGYYDGSLYSI
ncbi:hypothetical protein LT330_010585 [Penicillium expansum]|nr:hypothetical protein LT330_010585 [Penicillium expansum]